MEIIGSGGCGAGTRRFVGFFLLLSVGLGFWFTFLLLKVIALRHPATFTASCLWFPITLQQATGEEAFFVNGTSSIWELGFGYGVTGLALLVFSAVFGSAERFRFVFDVVFGCWSRVCYCFSNNWSRIYFLRALFFLVTIDFVGRKTDISVFFRKFAS